MLTVVSQEPTDDVQARAGTLLVAASAVRPLRKSPCHRGQRSHVGLARRRLLWRRSGAPKPPELPLGLLQNLDFRSGPAEPPAEFSAEPSAASVLLLSGSSLSGNSSGGCVAGETTEPVHDVSARLSRHDLEGDASSETNLRIPPLQGVANDASFYPSASSGAREPCSKELDASSLTFLHANVQGIFSKSADVAYLVERCNFPQIVGFTETFLDPSKHFSLKGYVQIARLDRRTGESQGGIILFAKLGFENSIVHIGDSKVHERSWFVVHTDRGAVLLALWHRRPTRGEVQSIEDLYDELGEFGENTIYTIVMGDMNVHEASWLRFSDGTSEEGRALQAFSNITGLEEKVGAPTRGDNLLDLVLSDLAGDLKCAVKPGVSDHEAVVGTISFGMPLEHTVERVLFDYKNAPWAKIKEDLSARDWDLELSSLCVDDAAAHVSKVIMETLRKHIRHKTSKVRVSTHPWLNDRCRGAIEAKTAAKGTADENIARDECSKILSEEYLKYVERTRTKLSELSNSAKQWWKLSNSLQGRGKTTHGVQPLKRSDGTWARTAPEKAALLSDTFLEKSRLPAESVNEFSPLPPGAGVGSDTFLPVRTKDVKRQLKKLKEDSATGPDEIAARVLKRCCHELAYPIALVIRRMVRDGRWPLCWRFHNIVPLYKKKARSDPKNYRGVHLTSQMSKVVERIVGRLFLPKLQSSGVYGEKQFAYSTGRGHQDALALSVLTWLQSLEGGQMVALYCSDVSGAFDRVCEERLGGKLERSGLHPRILKLLKSWLEPRSSAVVLDGCSSAPQVLQNSVYQGTVLGPPLWNVHYADSKLAVQAEGFSEVVFADDLNCSKVMPSATTETQARSALRKCQTSLHRWGAANKILFDPGKESFHGIHRTKHFGEDFKILGVIFDCQLTMRSAAVEISKEAGWKVKSLLRCRRFYTQRELVKLYKAQVLSYIESKTAAIHHAAPSVLDAIDRVQRRFLREIGLTEIDALLRYKLAPLSARRDIEMLGLLHRASHGKAPGPLADLLLAGTRQERDPLTAMTRAESARHQRQLTEYVSRGGRTDTMRRSCFGLVTIWNMLPPHAASTKHTKVCQRSLQQCLIRRALTAPDSDWQHFFLTEARVMPVRSFQRLFV